MVPLLPYPSSVLELEVFFLSFRHYGADCLSICAGSGISGECFCHLSYQKSEVPADPADAAYGSPRGHLEVTWIRSLRPQQGDLDI